MTARHSKAVALTVVRSIPVTPSACQDTIDVLKDLLADAERGEVTGLAFVAMRKPRAFVTHATGEALSNPTFTRGMVRALDDYLGDLVHRR